MLRFLRLISTLFFILAVLVNSPAFAASAVQMPVQIDGKLVPLKIQHDDKGFIVKRIDEHKAFLNESRLNLPLMADGKYRVREFFTIEDRLFIELEDAMSTRALAEIRFKVEKFDPDKVIKLFPLYLTAIAGSAIAVSLYASGLTNDRIEIGLFAASVAAVAMSFTKLMQQMTPIIDAHEQRVLVEQVNWIKGEGNKIAYDFTLKRNARGLVEDVVVQRNANPLDTYSIRGILERQNCEAKFR